MKAEGFNCYLWNPIKRKLVKSKRAFTNKLFSSNQFSGIWLNSEEAAGYLKVSVPQLFNLTSTGNLPYYKLGRSNRYMKTELDTYLEAEMRGIRDN
jgi:excisionase family DNA binding protein